MILNKGNEQLTLNSMGLLAGNTYIDGHYELNNNNVIEPFDNSTESQQLMNNKSHAPSLGYIDLDERIPDVDHIYNKLVIVTAFSQNHFMEAKGIIGTAQRQMPSKKIVVYDLGLNGETKKAVSIVRNCQRHNTKLLGEPRAA